MSLYNSLRAAYYGTIRPLFVGYESFAGRREVQNELLKRIFFPEEGDSQIPLIQRFDNARIAQEEVLGRLFDARLCEVIYTREEMNLKKEGKLVELEERAKRRWIDSQLGFYVGLERDLVDKVAFIKEYSRPPKKELSQKELKQYLREREEENPSLSREPITPFRPPRSAQELIARRRQRETPYHVRLANGRSGRYL